MGQLAGLRGSAGHVQSGQSERLGHIIGHLAVQGGLKQDGLADDVDTVDILMDGEDLVDLQRGHGQGHEGDDLVAFLQVEAGLVLQVLADVSDDALEHTAGAGDGVLLLAALGDDPEDHLADLLLVAAAGLGDLGEGSGVDVQGSDVADDLVGVDLAHVVVDLPSSLGQNALRLDNAVGTVLVAFQFSHDKFPPN